MCVCGGRSNIGSCINLKGDGGRSAAPFDHSVKRGHKGVKPFNCLTEAMLLASSHETQAAKGCGGVAGMGLWV